MHGIAELLTLPEVAEVTRAPLSTVRHWITVGKLRSLRPGRRRLVRRTDLDFLFSRRVRPMRGAATVRGNPDRGGLCPRDRWLAAVRRVKDRDLPPNAFRVAAELAAHSDAGLTRPCFPGERTIAEAVGLDVRTVQRMVACLEERGFLSVDRVRFKANRYRLGFPANGGANPATASV